MDSDASRRNTETLREFQGLRSRYRNPDYDDDEIEGLMRYFGMTDYVEFVDFIRKVHRD